MATGSVTEKAIEAVADVAEDVAEESLQVSEATRALSPKDISLFSSGMVLGTVAGLSAGYWLLNRRFKTKYEAIADEEIANMKEHYDRKLRALHNEDEKKTLEDVAKDLRYAVEGEEGGGKVAYHKVADKSTVDLEPPEVADIEPMVENVFDKTEDPEVEMEPAWDYAAEIRSRSGGVPYVIHRDEYVEGVSGPEEFEKYTLTYFEGDDVLCRDDDQIIEEQDEVIGLGNLSKFGHGSGDPNIVYIRNEKLKVDIEVSHSDGKYATEVAGFAEDELQHSSMRRRSPRRSERESDN